MSLQNIMGFAGENRAINPVLLAPDIGQYSRNQKPGRGDLRPWKGTTDVATVQSSAQTIYRMGRDTSSDSIYWLSWLNVVHAVRGFDTTDTTERTFYTGDTSPKVTDNVQALVSTPYPTSSRPLGIPAPISACTLTATGGSSITTNIYYYAYTYVSDWGWESAFSPLSAALTRKVDDITTITSFAAAPTGNYNINRIRIYRTQAGTNGSADFFFLREVAYGTTTTTDDLRDLGETATTELWVPAPGVPQGGSAGLTEPVLTFLTPMWNGMLAGISGYGVRICEPYVPYAWPNAYEIVPPDSKPVALGYFGQQLLILTTGKPIVVSGSAPDSMDQNKLELAQSCIAPRSVVSMGIGVCWASPDGLIFYGSGGVRNLTEGVMIRDDWQALVPNSIIGKMYEGRYFGSYNDGSGLKGFIVDPQNPKGMYFLDTGYAAAHFDDLNDQLYVYAGTAVKKWDSGTPMTCTYRTKTFMMPKPTKSWGCAEVVADTYPCTFKLYCDGTLIHTQTVTDNNAFRLPAGFYFQSYYVEFQTTGGIAYANLAHSPQELAEK